jgi:hypothetical protein
MHIEFITRHGTPAPYRGDYMFQYMTEDEVSLHTGILKEHFNDLFSQADMERMAKERVRG